MPPTTPVEDTHGRSQKKNIALAAWHAPLGGCIEEADLCRGQGFRRIAPSASPRFENRHVQGSAGSEDQEGILRNPDESGRGLPRVRDHLAPIWTPDCTLAARRSRTAQHPASPTTSCKRARVLDAAETTSPEPRPRGGACLISANG